MHKQLSVKAIPLTPELATEFATMNRSPGERPLKKERVAFLAKKIEDGEFHSPTWAFAWLRGVKYRVNGQHSSHMLSGANGHFPQGLSAVVYEFSCETDFDLAELFRQFDNPESIRSVGDAVNAHAKIEPELEGISKTAISRAVDGIGQYEKLNHGVRLSHIDRARLTHSHKSFIKWYSKYYCDRAFSPAPVCAAMYATSLVDTEDAAAFWQLAKDESHPSTQHPTRLMAKWLRELRSTRMPNAGPQRKYVATEIYERCIHAWNAYRAGRDLKQLKSYTTKAGGIAEAK